MKSIIRLSRRQFTTSTWTFQKGKLSLQKLKDKTTIDETIDQVNVVFPDQYGRLSGLKLNGEYFLETIETSREEAQSKDSQPKPMFEFKHNPFRFDILGKHIEFSDKVELPKNLLLSPDLSTLREIPWQKREAIVMADVYHPDTEELFQVAPRNILKSLPSDAQALATQIQFSVMLHKFSKDDKEQHHDTNKGMLTLDQGGWTEVLNECRKGLTNIGIPIQNQDQLSKNNQFRFHLRRVEKDLLAQCDMFHLAKHAIKFIGYNHQYDISSLPIDSSNCFNDLVLTVGGVDIHESQLQNVLFFAPNVNSIRRIKKRKNGQIFKKNRKGEYEIALAAPDVNLYLALFSLLSTKATDQPLEMPQTYSSAVSLFDKYKEQVDEKIFQYYKELYEHELKEFEETFSKWEVNRIY